MSYFSENLAKHIKKKHCYKHKVLRQRETEEVTDTETDKGSETCNESNQRIFLSSDYENFDIYVTFNYIQFNYSRVKP